MQITKIYLDVDGCFADFCSAVNKHWKQEWHPKGWRVLDRVDRLFFTLDLLPDAKFALAEIGKYSVPTAFLTAVPQPTNKLVTAGRDKVDWIRTVLGSDLPVFCSAGWKRKVAWVQPGAVLIDDMKRNCDAWEQSGGIAIHHQGDWKKTLENLALVNTFSSLNP